MAYLLDLFTPETWAAFREVGSSVTAFRDRHQYLAEQQHLAHMSDSIIVEYEEFTEV